MPLSMDATSPVSQSIIDVDRSIVDSLMRDMDVEDGNLSDDERRGEGDGGGEELEMNDILVRKTTSLSDWKSIAKKRSGSGVVGSGAHQNIKNRKSESSEGETLGANVAKNKSVNVSPLKTSTPFQYSAGNLRSPGFAMGGAGGQGGMFLSSSDVEYRMKLAYICILCAVVMCAIVFLQKLRLGD